MKTLFRLALLVLTIHSLAPHRHSVSQTAGDLTGSETIETAIDYTLGIWLEIDLLRGLKSVEWGETPNIAASAIALTQMEVARGAYQVERSEEDTCTFGCGQQP